jgi:hypothetical protein
MTDHHDFGFDHGDEPLPFDDHDQDHLSGYEDHSVPEEHGLYEVPDWHEPADSHVAELHEPEPHEPEEPLGEIAEPQELTDTAPAVEDVFPPALDVGDLPEPVDGFPWVDTAVLGAGDPHDDAPELEPVGAEELAAYAGQDPDSSWETLAGSDDPATAALARWWQQN